MRSASLFVPDTASVSPLGFSTGPAVTNVKSYASKHQRFPLPASLGPDKRPLLSWRVHLLPYFDRDDLYKQFHLDEPWDSPHNRALVDKMPDVYRSPDAKLKAPGRTRYLLPVGNGAGFERDKPTRLADLTDGTSNTIMIVEVDDDHAVIWTKPDDWEFDPKEPAKGLGPLGRGLRTALFDGSAQHLHEPDLAPARLRALVTRAGGEAVSR